MTRAEACAPRRLLGDVARFFALYVFAVRFSFSRDTRVCGQASRFARDTCASETTRVFFLSSNHHASIRGAMARRGRRGVAALVVAVLAASAPLAHPARSEPEPSLGEATVRPPRVFLRDASASRNNPTARRSSRASRVTPSPPPPPLERRPRPDPRVVPPRDPLFPTSLAGADERGERGGAARRVRPRQGANDLGRGGIDGAPGDRDEGAQGARAPRRERHERRRLRGVLVAIALARRRRHRLRRGGRRRRGARRGPAGGARGGRGGCRRRGRRLRVRGVQRRLRARGRRVRRRRVGRRARKETAPRERERERRPSGLGVAVPRAGARRGEGAGDFARGFLSVGGRRRRASRARRDRDARRASSPREGDGPAARRGA